MDVLQPELGLQQLGVNGQSLLGNLLCISRDDGRPTWQLPVADAYVRGHDLVASYQPADDWPYAPQVYWQADALEAVTGLYLSLSLLVSVQTHLLDTWPRITIGSQLRCNEVLQVHPDAGKGETLESSRTIEAASAACCLLRRLADAPISYVEIMPAHDFRELTIGCDDERTCHVEWRLFADFLEKGVIRRARMQAAFVSREHDLEVALACCQAMDRRPLPLTT